MRILLVEDDRQLAEGLKQSLKMEGFAVDLVENGKDALHATVVAECDMVILDLGLPDIDGIDVLKTIRKQKKTIPVLVLTARDSTQDKILGLDYGADDYLVKPFEPSELFARLRVFERRLGTASSSLIEIGQVCLDTASHSVVLDGEQVDASRREYMVLKALMENSGRIQSREQLESKLYEWGEEIASNVIEVHIHNLRKKLPPQFIKTIRGVGYSVNKA
ncbi:response regulator [Neptunicella sp. SCSIO 80796]|uniref:response regulator n=1 Tax=Neptunicella plasticusilytica TaxID=3117012 RepID=UPI003A4E3990